jgi:two-component system response regulator NreC
MAGAPITVVLADDHAVVRSGLRLVLEADDDVRVVAEAGTIDAAVDLTLEHRPDVVVLDLNMPGRSGTCSLSALPQLARETPGSRVVILTMQADPQFARQALGAGACGYVLKEAADTELVEAVRRAAVGQSFLNPRIGAQLATAPALAAHDLTARETDILRLIALGNTNAEVGAHLFLSVRTVETHRAHIQRKLRRSSRAELVRYALDRGLLEGV